MPFIASLGFRVISDLFYLCESKFYNFSWPTTSLNPHVSKQEYCKLGLDCPSGDLAQLPSPFSYHKKVNSVPCSYPGLELVCFPI